MTPVVGATYFWTGPQGYSATTANPVLPSATTGQAGAYTATLTIEGCSFAAPPAIVHVFTGIAAADDVFEVNFNETLVGGELVFNDVAGNVQNWDLQIVEAPENGTAKLVDGKYARIGWDQALNEIAENEERRSRDGQRIPRRDVKRLIKPPRQIGAKND